MCRGRSETCPLQKLFSEENFIMLDKIALIKGLPVIAGLVLVIISLIAQFVPFLSILTIGQWLLHLGVIIGLGGILFSDTL